MMRLFHALCIVAVLGSSVRAADASPAESGGTESLGSGLLDDLGPIGQPVTKEPSNQKATNTALQQNGPLPTVQSRQNNDGEDLGESPGSAPLVRVRQSMQEAQGLLGQPRVEAQAVSVQKAGAVQTNVVAQLDQLIAELSKQCQCQGGQCKPGDKPLNPGQRSQPKPGKSGSAAGRGQTAARDSTDRLDRSSAKAVDKGDIDEVVKNLWGHLPERSREQMMQSFSDEFLPKYEFEIEQYYRKLSEEQNHEPR